MVTSTVMAGGSFLPDKVDAPDDGCVSGIDDQEETTPVGMFEREQEAILVERRIDQHGVLGELQSSIAGGLPVALAHRPDDDGADQHGRSGDQQNPRHEIE